MLAVVRIRPQPHYRREAFIAGLSLLGYRIEVSGQPTSRADLLVLWNRMGADDRDAERWERDGGTVVVCENGYLGSDEQGRQLYAISIGQHHHGGSDADRYGPVALHPWRKDGEHILICAQRGIGSRLMASPPLWHVKVMDRLHKLTDRPLRLRMHPGNQPPKRSLEEDLQGAYACAVWSSGSGVKALSLGIPVMYDAPRWIGEGAAARSLSALRVDDALRLEAFRHMARNQWSVDEIQSGEPFRRMLASVSGSE
jgi:hypothetical protein